MPGSNSEGPRGESRWKPLKEGEISPYKILVSLFIREVFLSTSSSSSSSAGDGRRTDINSKTLLLIYDLISSYDLETYLELKSILEKPSNGVRPEVLKKFNRTISNMESSNSYFLYELANSIVTMEASQMVVLKKRVVKNSPFGKFLRGVYLNFKKLSYTQVEYMYKQLLDWVGIVPAGKTRTSWGKANPAPQRSLKGLDLFQKMSMRGKETDLSLFGSYIVEYRKMMGEQQEDGIEKLLETKLEIAEKNKESKNSLRELWTNPPRKKKETSLSPQVKGGRKTGAAGEERKRKSPRGGPAEVSVKRVTRSSSSPMVKESGRAVKRSSSLRRIYLSSPRPTSLTSSSPSLSLSPARATRSATKAAATESSFPSTSTLTLSSTIPSARPVEMTTKIIATGSITVRVKVPVPPTKSNKTRKDSQSPYKSGSNSSVLAHSGKEEPMDVEMKSPVASPMLKFQKSSSSPKKSPRLTRKTSAALMGDEKGNSGELLQRKSLDSPSSEMGNSPLKSRRDSSKKTSGSLSSRFDAASSSEDERKQKDKAGWYVIKRWSRKQIERAIKSLVDRLYSANSSVPTPEEISRFVMLAITNPSSAVLYSQLYYLEYLNCLRTKDVARCMDFLRTTFDVRRKSSSTAELSKGATYAAYNSALFYHQIGYKEDATVFLGEAFRAGHAAGDSTCLHHCHNLWSHFRNKSYSDAIVTVAKEVDNNMAYLHSQNVIVNAFDLHSREVYPDEVLHTLWHYNADCDLEEMEGLLLSALANFFVVYGWHDLTSFPSQMILSTRWKWSSRFYAFHLCSLAQSLLYHGDVEAANEIIDYGRRIFEYDSSLAGESFMVQSAVFEALKCFLAYEPVSDDILLRIDTIDNKEARYWKGYNLMVLADFRAAIVLLHNLKLEIEPKEGNDNYLNTDLKLRCLCLLAELECLCDNCSSALEYILEALNISTNAHSDVYTTLTLYHLAAVQCEDGMVQTGLQTIERQLHSVIRCGNPWLTAKMNVIKARIMMRSEGIITLEKFEELFPMLEFSMQLYQKWGNKYRIKEVMHLQAELIDRAEDIDNNGSDLRDRLLNIDSTLTWSERTCIL